METVWNIRGASGRIYTYYVTIPPWKKIPANYLFAKAMGSSLFIPYVGETGDASDRLPRHDRWEEAVRTHGASVVLTHVSSSIVGERQREERDLIESLRPPMNVQH